MLWALNELPGGYLKQEDIDLNKWIPKFGKVYPVGEYKNPNELRRCISEREKDRINVVERINGERHYKTYSTRYTFYYPT